MLMIYLANNFQIKTKLKSSLKLLLQLTRTTRPFPQVNFKIWVVKMKIHKIKAVLLNIRTNKFKITNKSYCKQARDKVMILVLLSKFPNMLINKHFYKMSFKTERMKIHSQIHSCNKNQHLIHKVMLTDKVLRLDSESKARKV